MTLKRHKMPYTPKQSVFALEERHLSDLHTLTSSEASREITALSKC